MMTKWEPCTVCGCSLNEDGDCINAGHWVEGCKKLQEENYSLKQRMTDLTKDLSDVINRSREELGRLEAELKGDSQFINWMYEMIKGMNEDILTMSPEEVKNQYSEMIYRFESVLKSQKEKEK